MCISASNFYMNIINNKRTLLYNLPIIHSIQRYNGLCELTNFFYPHASVLIKTISKQMRYCLSITIEDDQIKIHQMKKSKCFDLHQSKSTTYTFITTTRTHIRRWWWYLIISRGLKSCMCTVLLNVLYTQIPKEH